MRRPSGYRLLVNEAAGAADHDAAERVRERLSARGLPAEVVATDGEGDVDAALADLPPGWGLGVCGGDGSLHVAVQRLWAAGRAGEVAVGLVPLGTGNDLARGVDLPLEDVDAAADRLVDGAPAALDLLVDEDGRVCANAMHVGVGAEVAEQAERLKPRLAALAYPVSALLGGLTEAAGEARVVVDGDVVADGAALLVGLCNGPTIGGGARLAPDADPADGLVDVVVARAVGGAERAGFGLDLQRSRHLERDDVTVARGREVVVAMPDARWDVDGEVEPAAPRRAWTLHPGAWWLLR